MLWSHDSKHDVKCLFMPLHIIALTIPVSTVRLDKVRQDKCLSTKTLNKLLFSALTWSGRQVSESRYYHTFTDLEETVVWLQLTLWPDVTFSATRDALFVCWGSLLRSRTWTPFTRVPTNDTNFCTDKNQHASTPACVYTGPAELDELFNG